MGGDDIDTGTARNESEIGGRFFGDSTEFHICDSIGGNLNGGNSVFWMFSCVGGFADKCHIESIVGGGSIDETTDGRAGIEDVAVGEVEVLKL